jgi:hypothetical protein
MDNPEKLSTYGKQNHKKSKKQTKTKTKTFLSSLSLEQHTIE